MPKFELIIGNIGQVLVTDNEIHAQNQFNAYAHLSESDYGRAAGEPVTLLRDGEIIREHPGTSQKGK